MRIDEAEVDDDAEETFDAWMSEVIHKIETGDFKVMRPREKPKDFKVPSNGYIDFSKRTHFFLENFCSSMVLKIAALRQREANGVQAIFVNLPQMGEMVLYLGINDDTDPDAVLTKDMVLRNLHLIDDNDDMPIRKTLFHEYVHYLQDAGGLENIKRNIIMCWTPYRQLKWEIEAHVAEFYASFTMRIKRAGSRQEAVESLKRAGIDFSPYAAEGKDADFSAAVFAGKFSRADKNFNAILEANQKSKNRKYLEAQLRKAHRIILSALEDRPR